MRSMLALALLVASAPIALAGTEATWSTTCNCTVVSQDAYTNQTSPISGTPRLTSTALAANTPAIVLPSMTGARLHITLSNPGSSIVYCNSDGVAPGSTGYVAPSTTHYAAIVLAGGTNNPWEYPGFVPNTALVCVSATVTTLQVESYP